MKHLWSNTISEDASKKFFLLHSGSCADCFCRIRVFFYTLSVKKYFLRFGFTCLIFFLLLAILNAGISIFAGMYRFESVEDIPKNPVGLVLGTSQFTSDGEPNVFYSQRVDATKRLYDAKKIDCVLISGDNTSDNYNEPIDMQQSLLSLGIPSERMYLDYAGVRTLDSIIRAKEIFSLEKFTIISQPFHIDRAILIAKSQ